MAVESSSEEILPSLLVSTASKRSAGRPAATHSSLLMVPSLFVSHIFMTSAADGAAPGAPGDGDAPVAPGAGGSGCWAAAEPAAIKTAATAETGLRKRMGKLSLFRSVRGGGANT